MPESENPIESHSNETLPLDFGARERAFDVIDSDAADASEKNAAWRTVRVADTTKEKALKRLV